MLLLFCAWVACATDEPKDDTSPHAGFIVDKFSLTLAPGHRTEAAGPFFYNEQREGKRTWAIPPLLSYTRDEDTDSEEFDLGYPILTYDRYGGQYRWQFFQLLSLAGGPSQNETARNRFSIFPFYLQQRSSDPSQNYTSVLPFYGHLKNRLFRDEVFFVMLPIFVESRKKDVVTDNYVYPLFHLRHGDRLKGWQFWPLLGHEHKEITSQTNGFSDVSTVPGHDRLFVLWPLFFNQHNGIGSDNPQWQQGSLPAYNFLRSPQRDSTTVLWPFFSWINDREKKYREWQLPWPFIVVARGEGKTTTRFFPLFSRAHSSTLESDFFLWPVYKFNRVHSDPLDRKRTRILFFLYSDTLQKNTEMGDSRRRTDFWPLFTRQRDYNGNTRLQVLALLEPLLPASKSIERDYSPVWSFWRSEKSPRTGASSQSLLWNLYRHEAAPDQKRTSAFFGLFQYQSFPRGRSFRFFYLPTAKRQPQPRPDNEPRL
jgi:hypothetical protein